MASPALVRGSRMVYEGGEVDVQWIGVSLATIIDEQGRSFTVPISRLKPIKATRLTDVQAAAQGDPELLGLIRAHYFSNGGETFVSCQAAVREAEAEKLSSISGLSPSDALDYISEATDKSHGAKYYLVVANGAADPALFERMARYFCIEAHTSKNSHQFNSRPLVEWLIKEHGVLPKKRY